MSRHSTQPTPRGARPNLPPDVLMDFTRGMRKSQARDLKGARKGRGTLSAGAIHVDVDVEAGLFLQLVERLRELEHRFIRPGIGHAECRHHHDGVLVHLLEHLLDVHIVAPGDIGISRISMSQ